MDNIKRLDRIIADKKWIKNDIGMGRVQCAKVMVLNDEMLLIISSEVTEKPVWARVEKILAVNNEIILFYDGEYCEELEADEYDEYSSYIDRQEWDLLYEEDTTAKLEEKGLISNTDGFYVNVHENIERYEDEFDEEESEKLNQHYNI